MKKILFLLIIGLIIFSGCVTKQGEKIMAAGFFSSETKELIANTNVNATFSCTNQGITVKADQLNNSTFVLTIPEGCGNLKVIGEAEGFLKKTETIPEDVKKAEITLEIKK
ncbi:MAG: hypothetical protein COT15_03330 [Candidatus Diapherotrites archaeon CG08_land_8_20_14_0_20_34_12]|nr:MAG: hypothetical protein COT15_03330 [Candidatus Diapherotrites archaeon CG08_land_8_20_14_0_20_34_12]